SAPVSLHVPILQPPIPPLFPYTTLFRSEALIGLLRHHVTGIVDQVAVVACATHHRVAAKLAIKLVIACAPVQCVVIRSAVDGVRSEEHTSELQSLTDLVCRLLLATQPLA